MAPPYIPILNRRSIATRDPALQDRGWGVTGFDKEIGMYVRAAKLGNLLKPPQNLSANKTARGVLSPIQVADLQPAYAIA